MTSNLLAQILARDPRKLVRFPELPLDEALAALHRIEGVLEERQAPEPAGSQAGDREAQGAIFANLATQVWRAAGRMIDPATGEPREEMKRVHRHVAGALESLAGMGLTITDWMNQPYDAGLPVKVLAFQPVPGIPRDTIVEAIRPTVMWKDRLVQVGEVIVGTPDVPRQENP